MAGDSPDTPETLDVTRDEEKVAELTGSTETGQTLERTLPAIPGAESLASDAFSAQSSALGNLANIGQGDLTADLDPATRQALRQLGNFGENPAFTDPFKFFQGAVRGDNIFGGDEYNATIEAAQRASLPGLIGPGGFRAGAAHLGGFLGEAGIQAGLKFSDARRKEQFQAAQFLPQLGMMPIEALLRKGGIFQQQAQNEITGGIDFQRQFAALGQGIAPLPNFLGSAGTGTTDRTASETSSGSSLQSQPIFEDERAGFAGDVFQGAGIGAQVGSVVPGIGTVAGLGIGGIAGGLLGLV